MAERERERGRRDKIGLIEGVMKGKKGVGSGFRGERERGGERFVMMRNGEKMEKG